MKTVYKVGQEGCSTTLNNVELSSYPKMSSRHYDHLQDSHRQCIGGNPSYLVYKHIFFGVISVGRQKKKKKKKKNLQLKGLSIQRRFKEQCIMNKDQDLEKNQLLNSLPFQKRCQEAIPMTHLSQMPLPCSTLQCGDPSTGFHTHRIPHPFAHTSFSITCYVIRALNFPPSKSKTVKRTGHSCELGSPYTET